MIFWMMWRISKSTDKVFGDLSNRNKEEKLTNFNSIRY